MIFWEGIRVFLALSGAPLVILSILAFVIILGIIISIHEFGHFYFARKAGILCHEFSIGFGPIIYRHQFGETLFCIRAIPIGGFVSMADGELTSNLIKVGDEIGLNTENELVSEIILDEKRECEIRGEVVSFDFYGKNDNPLYVTLNVSNEEKYFEVKRDAFYVFEKNQRLQIEPYERSFDSKSVLQRFLTLFAGPMMNFVLAIFIYIIVAFASGVPNTKSNVIGEVESDYPAAVAESFELDGEGNILAVVIPRDNLIVSAALGQGGFDVAVQAIVQEAKDVKNVVFPLPFFPRNTAKPGKSVTTAFSKFYSFES
jgi:regulator of sigma E protease